MLEVLRQQGTGENVLSDLRQAARNGEAFAQVYALAYWPDAAANTRDSLPDALATVMPALVKDDSDTPPDASVMRRVLRTVAFVPEDRRAEATPDMAAALRWLERHSLPTPELVMLPEKGWGSLVLAKSLPEAGKRWADSGDGHDARGLKHRDEDEARTVPIPPDLVRILREHIDTYGVTEDGRLVRTRTGRPFTYSAIYRVLQDARLAFPPDKQASMLADTPYALRHAAISTWLNAGISPSEASERAGNSEEMILSVYGGCLDGDRERMNKRIEAALNADYG